MCWLPRQDGGNKRILYGIVRRSIARRALCGRARQLGQAASTTTTAYFLIADYQVSDFADDLPRVRNAVWEVALDWLSVGLDPEGASFVIESTIPEHTELMTWLAWFMPVGMLERNPTLKAEMEAIESPEDATTRGKSVPVAFYIYPVMQVANILTFRAHLVPVGEDQLPHIELTREVARRFNRD
jgi:tryptophanyl-tRNA synthetase